MGWVAKLSNNEVIEEAKPKPGEMSSWQSLLLRCREENLEILSLSLVVEDMVVEAMPYEECDGYMQAYEVTKSIFSGKETIKQGIGSIVNDQAFITWITLDTTHRIEKETRPLSGVKIHSTL